MLIIHGFPNDISALRVSTVLVFFLWEQYFVIILESKKRCVSHECLLYISLSLDSVDKTYTVVAILLVIYGSTVSCIE